MTGSLSHRFLALCMPAMLLAATPLNARSQTTARFDSEEMAVPKAAESGQAALAKITPPCSSKLTGTADDGTTFLQWALANGKKRAFLALLRSGADPSQMGFDGETVVHDAARHRDSKWLKLLLEQGASPNVRNLKSGTVPLTRALMADRDKQFEMLLKAGADPNLADVTGNTALHIAALINKPWHVYMLLTNRDAPADPSILNAQGETFQRYLFMTQDRLLNNRTREARHVVLGYLWLKGIPIDPDALPFPKRGFTQH